MVDEEHVDIGGHAPKHLLPIVVDLDSHFVCPEHVEATGGAFNLPLAVDAEHVANKPRAGATIVRSLSARTPVTVPESKEGWPLVASKA